MQQRVKHDIDIAIRLMQNATKTGDSSGISYSRNTPLRSCTCRTDSLEPDANQNLQSGLSVVFGFEKNKGKVIRCKGTSTNLVKQQR